MRPAIPTLALLGLVLPEGSRATLDFPEAGKVAGNGSCNRFSGTVEIAGGAHTFGRLGSTRRACAEAIGTQEARYFQALQNAERFARRDPDGQANP